MHKNLKWKLLIIAIVGGLAFWRAYPPFDIVSKDGKVLEKGKINLGLDLQGGMHMVLEVDTSALEEEAAKDAPERALEVIRNRIDQFGVLEPTIQKQGKNKIIVQLPGITDRQRAIDIVGKTAHLEFKLVSDDPDVVKRLLAGEEVEGYSLKYLKKDKNSVDPIIIEDKTQLTGEMIVDATTEFSQTGFNQPYVSMTFNKEGGAVFSAITGDNIDRRLAIVLDGEVKSAPSIRERIPSGRAQITGNFSVDEANDLAIILRAGALPAPVKMIEERTVGPTLGKDSIEKGIRSIIIGGILVLCFMAVYYLLAGLIADLALVMNIILIMGALAYFHGTLTLPGIAGLVLTIGMAVDANVLIFERIREEKELGKSIRSAIQSGFDRAFLTILDANVTTLIAALVLFQFGTGPVRGFATTLSIGIVSSMFTALFVTRVVFDVLTTGNKKIQDLPMLKLINKSNIDFIKLRKIAYTLSVFILVAGLITFAQRGSNNYGIDFTGGTIQQFKFEKAIDTQQVRDVLKDIGLGSAVIQKLGDNKEFIIRSFELDPEKIIAQFKNTFSDNDFEVLRVEKVGSSVGADLQSKAIKALAFAMICMVIYISLRFEVRFAVAAIIALLHDIGICLGLLSLTGREISTPVIAALLTIVGYSINDTIVVFDRIREDRKLMRKASYAEIINASINQTLSRTLLTSLTTFAVVIALFLFGGEVINDFAFVLMVGVVVGTYSSIFIASPILLDWPGKRVVKR
ncbi:MAG: protein translocase subunit SecD [Candidatus Omnitrophica bacterium]|nr:protein translocase subunit SecD [Candidatus Omnitrophota bacterium]